MAGFRLYQVYPKPFMRVMQAIVTEFIEKLKANGDADARAVVSRLETYLQLQKYLQEPEGRKMPATTVSFSLRAWRSLYSSFPANFGSRFVEQTKFVVSFFYHKRLLKESSFEAGPNLIQDSSEIKLTHFDSL